MKTTKKHSTFKDEAFAKHVKVARSHRLAIMLVNLIDLKVKGIITEQEYRQQKRKLLGF